MAKLDFDAREVPPADAFDPIPNGWYPARAVKSEMKPTKANDGHYLNVDFEITDGEYQGRHVFDRFNLDNKNEQAVAIAQRSLSAWVRACGKLAVGDSEELHGIEVLIKVKVKPAQGQYDASNEIKGYKSIDGKEITDDDDSGEGDPPPPAAVNPLAKQNGGKKQTAPWGR